MSKTGTDEVYEFEDTNSQNATVENSLQTESRLPPFTHARNADQNKTLEDGERKILHPGGNDEEERMPRKPGAMYQIQDNSDSEAPQEIEATLSDESASSVGGENDYDDDNPAKYMKFLYKEDGLDANNKLNE